MTQNSRYLGPKLHYLNQIPQNTAAMAELAHVLVQIRNYRACGFLLGDKRFKRVVMDYMDEEKIEFYPSSEVFLESKKIKELC